MGRTENRVNKYNDYLSKILPGFSPWQTNDKRVMYEYLIQYMFDRTLNIFKWENLPDTIPERILELYLQINGNCVFMERENGIYIYVGGLGGEPDVYYQPTIYTISNPAQKFSTNAEIDKDCILMRNDSLLTGLLPIHSRYASQMVETEISLYDANINSRIISLISAQDDRTQKSAMEYINDIIEGKIGVISEAKFFEDLKSTPFSTSGASGTITNLIELMQYQKASWFNEIGLNANYNMKREAINSNESQLNRDSLNPLIDDMFKNRKIAIDKVNARYGLNISVDLDSAWKNNEIEEQKELENIGGENDVDETETKPVD